MKTIDSLSSSDGLESAIEHVLKKMLANGKIGAVQNDRYSDKTLTLQNLHSTTSVPSNIIISNDNDRSTHQLDNFEAKELPAQDQASIIHKKVQYNETLMIMELNDKVSKLEQQLSSEAKKSADLQIHLEAQAKANSELKGGFQDSGIHEAHSESKLGENYNDVSQKLALKKEINIKLATEIRCQEGKIWHQSKELKTEIARLETELEASRNIEDILKRECDEANADAWERDAELDICRSEHHNAIQNIRFEPNKAVQGLKNTHYHVMASDHFKETNQLKMLLDGEKETNMILSKEKHSLEGKIGCQREALVALNAKFQAINKNEQETKLLKSKMLELEQELESETALQEPIKRENMELKLVLDTQNRVVTQLKLNGLSHETIAKENKELKTVVDEKNTVISQLKKVLLHLESKLSNQRKNVSQMETCIRARNADIMKQREETIQLKEAINVEKAATRRLLKEKIHSEKQTEKVSGLLLDQREKMSRLKVSLDDTQEVNMNLSALNDAMAKKIGRQRKVLATLNAKEEEYRILKADMEEHLLDTIQGKVEDLGAKEKENEILEEKFRVQNEKIERQCMELAILRRRAKIQESKIVKADELAALNLKVQDIKTLDATTKQQSKKIKSNCDELITLGAKKNSTKFRSQNANSSFSKSDNGKTERKHVGYHAKTIKGVKSSAEEAGTQPKPKYCAPKDQEPKVGTSNSLTTKASLLHTLFRTSLGRGHHASDGGMIGKMNPQVHSTGYSYDEIMVTEEEEENEEAYQESYLSSDVEKNRIRKQLEKAIPRSNKRVSNVADFEEEYLDSRFTEEEYYEEYCEETGEWQALPMRNWRRV